MIHHAWHDDYLRMAGDVGLLEPLERTQVELTDDDRAKFLNNLCTNEIRKLEPGQGTEAMLLDAKGHIQFHVLVYNRGESLVLDTVAGVGSRLVAHLDRYLIREKVVLHDRSSDWAMLLIAGPKSTEFLQHVGLTQVPEQMLQHVEATIADQPAHVRRVPFAPWPAFELCIPRSEEMHFTAAMIAAGAAKCAPQAFETARIEALWPKTGIDITDKSLPQELGRDGSAISFVKGCYIGQETVARIDALGHVNKYLTRLKFAGDEIPAAGAELTAGGQPAGSVTSAAWSPRLKSAIALAYIRRGLHAPRSRLDSPVGQAEVF